jgi:hypothetical protein
VDETEEVVVLEVDLDGRTLDFLLTDIFEVADRRYATLVSDDEFLTPEERTIFARVTEVEGEDRFEVIEDPIEMEMVSANATLDVVEDILFGIKSSLSDVISLLQSIDPAGMSDDSKKSLGIVYSRVQSVLESLREEVADEASDE